MCATRFLVLFLCLWLAACASGATTRPEASSRELVPATPPIQEQSTSLRTPDSPYRTVVPGDTLYSIAWESGCDYRELARWNRISAPYTIKPGQQLRVIPPSAPQTTDTPDKGGTPAKTVKHGPKSPSKATAAAGGKKPVAAAVPATAPKTQGGGKSVHANASPKSTKAASTTKPTTVAAKANNAITTQITGGWSWPTDGKVLNRYSESESKGLDIAGARGDPVRAAADGRVVYQGSGLRGYGQLIIVKHSDEFLSAYAHNDRIHVKEGEAVKRGQKIADMGSTGTDRVKLHFEIRRRGAPVDPLKHLPKR